MMFWTILFLIFGFLLLIKSADFLVDGAAGIAKRLRVPKMIVGLTLVAFATSLPEGAVSVIATLENSPDLTVGNIIGSNIANIALILGVAAFVRAMPVTRTIITRGLPLNLLAVAVLIILGFDRFFQNHGVDFNRFTLGDGLIFLCFFIVFLSYIYGDLKAAHMQEHEIEKKEKVHLKESFPYLSLLLAGGLAGVLVGGKMVVDNAVSLAHVFHVSEALIGLTVVAVGTSLPELVTSVVAAAKRESDIAVGNIIGTNVFNIFLVLGVTSVISPVNFDPKLLVDAFFMLFITALFFVLVARGRNLSRMEGLVLIVSYVVYLISLGFRETVFALFPL